MLSFKRLIEENYKQEIEAEIVLLLNENTKEFGLAYYNRSDFKEIELINLAITRISINDYKPYELELIIQVRMTWLVTVEADDRWEQFTPWANLHAFIPRNHSVCKCGDTNSTLREI